MPNPGIRFANEVDFRKGHVQDDTVFKGGKGYVSSESIVIAAKVFEPNTSLQSTSDQAPDLAQFIAIGLVENLSLASQRNIQQLFEIGSRDPYFIPGRTVIQAALNRVIFDGDSLLRVLYPTQQYGTEGAHGFEMDPAPILEAIGGSTNVPGVTELDAPDFWFNLASEFFNKPATLALVVYNDNAELLGYVVLEDCYVEAHNLALAAAQTVITENVRLRVTRIATVAGNYEVASE